MDPDTHVHPPALTHTQNTAFHGDVAHKYYYRHHLSSAVIISHHIKGSTLPKKMPGMQHKNIYGYKCYMQIPFNARDIFSSGSWTVIVERSQKC